MTRFPLRPIAVAALVAVAVAWIGGMATDTGPWYEALEKPALQPPDGIFGPVWTVLYILIVVSAVIAWERARNPAERRNVVLLYGANAVLNLGWTLLFFGARLPVVALVEISVLWLQILLIILYVRRFSGWAAALLIPYLLWVGFATYLNFELQRRNPPEAFALQPRAESLASAPRISSAAPSPRSLSSTVLTARSASALP